MKRIIMILGTVITALATTSAFAQNEGVITYEVTINNHRTLPPEREGMKAMVPEYRTFKQQLFFNATESLYKPLIEDEDEEDDQATRQGGGGRFRFRMMGATIYLDQATNIMLSQMDVMGKKYLITDTLK